MSGVMFLGWSATFAVLWLRRALHPTDWAKYPALGLVALALLIFVLGTSFDKYWSVLLIIGGALLLYTGMRRKTS